MMSDTQGLLLAFLAGGLIGAAYFGGLWWTIQKGMISDHPARWFSVSLLVRTGIALTGFYFVGRENWQRMLLCLAGFLIARLLVTWMTRIKKSPNHKPQEDGHASHSR
jgi:F1F0 ATPase subunit 2